MTTAMHRVWGPELSPFVLKLEAMLAYRQIPFRRLPRDGSRLENTRAAWRIDRAKSNRTATRPNSDPLDEFPLVPFLLTPEDQVLYDSSALAGWLDTNPNAFGARLRPEDAALRFVCNFLDEGYDEFGLYMVHHNRWKLAAGDNGDPGLRLAREYRHLRPPGIAPVMAWWFERRQVRRLPYLFSVAPKGYDVPALSKGKTAPSRHGFPPTHDILERSWERCLLSMEALLAEQPWILGGGFTLADASAYGQLSMNLTDTGAARRLRELAPRVHAWLEAIRDRRHVGARGELRFSPLLAPLLRVFVDTFVPLMRANDAAYERALVVGETLFNEKAFDVGRSLFDGEMLGRPYRSVVKTFQVRVWRDLRSCWSGLTQSDRSRIATAFGGYDIGEDLGVPQAALIAAGDPDS